MWSQKQCFKEAILIVQVWQSCFIGALWKTGRFLRYFSFCVFFLYPPDLSVVLRNGIGKRRPILRRLSEIHSENRDFGRKIPHFRHRSGAIPQRDLDETRIFQSGLGGATTLAPSEGKSRSRTATVGFLCSNRTNQPIRVFFPILNNRRCHTSTPDFEQIYGISKP